MNSTSGLSLCSLKRATFLRAIAEFLALMRRVLDVARDTALMTWIFMR